MRPNFGCVLAVVFVVALTTVPHSAEAQDAAQFPNHPVTIVVPASAGAGADIFGRMLAAGITGPLGQPVIIQNIAGPANVAGAAAVARAKPDGYTLLFTNIIPLGVVQNFRKDIPYSVDDLIPVSQTDQSAQMLVVRADLPAKTVPELIALLKKDPGKYNFGSAGIGQVNHLSVELFMYKTGTSAVHIPYKGSGESAIALAGGTVDFVIDGVGSFMPWVQQGKARALAIATPVRQKELPDLPTITESVPSFPGFYTWRGIFAPRGTPDAVVQKLNKVIGDFLRSPEGIQQAAALSATAAPSTPQELADIIKKDSATWADLFKDGHLHIAE
jgi:tripartite-type tricarboxylate transporter receptor subunit TctC